MDDYEVPRAYVRVESPDAVWLPRHHLVILVCLQQVVGELRGLYNNNFFFEVYVSQSLYQYYLFGYLGAGIEIEKVNKSMENFLPENKAVTQMTGGKFQALTASYIRNFDMGLAGDIAKEGQLRFYHNVGLPMKYDQ